MLLIIAEQEFGMQIWIIIFVKFYCNLIEQTLDILDVRIVFCFSIYLVASNDHYEFINLEFE